MANMMQVARRKSHIPLIVSDPLAIGLETRDCAAIGSAGDVSSWLYALGPLTKPA
jgi:hypothetical protein